MPNPIEIASQLIKIPSLSFEELEVLKYAESLLGDLGWPVERIPVDAATYNLFAGSDRCRYILTTHLDVVPVSSPNQFIPAVKDGRLYGRGACDAKGIAAAMLVCGTELRRQGNEEVGLLFVVGEEYDGRGALAAIDFLRQRNIVALINGEPTENVVASAQKGAVDFEVRCHGKSAHSGYPELGFDANRIVFEILKDLYSNEWPANKRFGASTLNVGVLEGGVAANVIAEQARLRALLRSGMDSQLIKQIILSVVADRGEVVFSYEANPVEFFVPDGMKSEVFPYVSDAAFFNQLKIKILQCGPGSIHHAHTDHEYIETEELERGVAVYTQLLEAVVKS